MIALTQDSGQQGLDPEDGVRPWKLTSWFALYKNWGQGQSWRQNLYWVLLNHPVAILGLAQRLKSDHQAKFVQVRALLTSVQKISQHCPETKNSFMNTVARKAQSSVECL